MSGRVLWLPDKMREYGVKVQLVDGWTTRGDATLNPEVVIVHHDAIAGPASAPGLRLVTVGRSDLPGPLCQVYLGRDGTAYMVASGKANHAGAGSWKGFTLNTQALGIEAANDGRGEPWPLVQLEAYYRIVAAMLDGIGNDASYTCGHKEWAPTRKIDPYGIDMNDFRREVAIRLAKTPQEAMMTGQYIGARMVPGAQLQSNGRLTFIAVKPDGTVHAYNQVAGNNVLRGDVPSKGITLNKPICGFELLTNSSGVYYGYVLFAEDGGTYVFK